MTQELDTTELPYISIKSVFTVHSAKMVAPVGRRKCIYYFLFIYFFSFGANFPRHSFDSLFQRIVCEIPNRCRGVGAGPDAQRKCVAKAPNANAQTLKCIQFMSVSTSVSVSTLNNFFVSFSPFDAAIKFDDSFLRKVFTTRPTQKRLARAFAATHSTVQYGIQVGTLIKWIYFACQLKLYLIFRERTTILAD